MGYNKKVIIVGGGIGGLSCSCFLAKEGFDVTLIEKNENVGGRASVLQKGGYRFDMGPSWYLMPDVFERFFDSMGKKRENYFKLEKLTPSYRVFFKDGDRVDVYPDKERMSKIFESYEKGAGEKFRKYIEKSRRNYEVSMKYFVLQDRSRLRDFLSLDVLKNARGLTLIGSMKDHVNKYFEEKKLQQIMQYSLVFLGGSPENTPALYNLMSHVDFNQGVYYPEGGIFSVIEALKDITKEYGTKVKTSEEVKEIKPEDKGSETGRKKNIVRTSNHSYETDIVVSNADYAYTELELLDKRYRSYGKKYWESKTLAPSAFLIYLGLDEKFKSLEHHNLILPISWEKHFDKIFNDPQVPENPSYYVCNPTRTDSSVAPEGNSSIFILVPIAPGIEFDKRKFRDLVINDLEENTGTKIEKNIQFEKIFSVEDFGDMYNSFKGTALGLAHTLRQTAFMRPSRKSSKIDGLYYTGAYTNPGIGMPMCLISGEQTADRIIDDIQ